MYMFASGRVDIAGSGYKGRVGDRERKRKKKKERKEGREEGRQDKMR